MLKLSDLFNKFQSDVENKFNGAIKSPQENNEPLSGDITPTRGIQFQTCEDTGDCPKYGLNIGLVIGGSAPISDDRGSIIVSTDTPSLDTTKSVSIEGGESSGFHGRGGGSITITSSKAVENVGLQLDSVSSEGNLVSPSFHEQRGGSFVHRWW